MTKIQQMKYENGFYDTDTFRYHNRNPNGLITSDCSTRTICEALGITYGEAVDLQSECAKRTYIGLTDADLIETILLEHGFKKVAIKAVASGGRRENAGRMAKRLATGDAVLVMRVANHFTVAKKGHVLDVWNCTGKTVYRAFIKG